MSRLKIELKRVNKERLFEARVVSGLVTKTNQPLLQPILDNYGNISVRMDNPDKAAKNLMHLILGLGYSGDFEINTVVTPFEFGNEPFAEAPKEKFATIQSDDYFTHKRYRVSYLEGRDPEYMCECKDFIYRQKNQGGHCKHITRAIEQNLLK